MKKLTLLAVIAMAGIIAATGCKKAEKAPEEPAEKPAAEAKGAATPENISGQLSTVLCKRLVECTKDAEGNPIMPEDECVTQTQASLTQALKEKNLNITNDQLNTCLKAIKDGSCADITGTEAPKGCEFLN